MNMNIQTFDSSTSVIHPTDRKRGAFDLYYVEYTRCKILMSNFI